jgi:tetratricopeptide (TPR) repeat protein
VGQYDIEVSAVGYLTTHKNVMVGGALNTYRIDVVLQPDPSAVDLDAPITSGISAKARKETQRAVAALKSGEYKQAQKHLEAAYKMAPSSTDVNFLLGYLFVQKKDLSQAKAYLGNASNAGVHNVQALTLLGRLQLQEKDYAQATSTLERAVAANGDYWIAHNLLADTYLHQKEYEKARGQAELAIDKGKGAGGTSQMILGEALANLGRNQEALDALNRFLQSNSSSPAAPQVRDFIAFVERRLANPAAAAEPAPKIEAPIANAEGSAEADDLRLSIKTWEPPGVDDVKPSVAADVACPYDKVVDQAGVRVKELVDNVARFQAIEDLVHENVDELGHATSKETRQFNYLAEISGAKPGWLEVNEYRGVASAPADFPDQIATRGLPALALIFHPVMRDNFQMTCEGLGDWRGQATWLVHFRQRDDKPNRIHAYNVGHDVYEVGLKGRAWIAANNFQIVHMESDLVNPMRKIQLLTEHESVDYGPVFFEKKKEELWLPKSADLYFDFRRHRYHRRHSFDHFMLFSVDSSEQRKEPKEEEKPQGPPQNPTPDH